MATCAAYALIWGPTFDRRYLHVIDHVKALGFDGIEIPLVTSILKELPVREMHKRLSEAGISAVFCTGLERNQNIASDRKRVRVRGIDHLKRCLDVVAEFQGNVLAGVIYGVWGGFSGNPPTEAELEHSAESLKAVAQHARPMNIDLALEPISRFEGYLIATAQDGLAYIAKVGEENVGLHLDTFQMNIEEKSLPAAILSAKGKLFHFHICASDRGVPGTGHIDWKGVFGALRKIGYQRWFTVESFSPDPGGAGSAAKVWRELAPSSDHIAEGGLGLVRKYYGG
jgi:D-psicose/D-tagatose/L-ribulose 3-epimerase